MSEHRQFGGMARFAAISSMPNACIAEAGMSQRNDGRPNDRCALKLDIALYRSNSIEVPEAASKRPKLELSR